MPTWRDPGYYFFRGEFTLTGDITPVQITVTGDNFFTFFLEGVPILGEEINKGDHFMWQGWKEHKIFLPAGTYTVAAAVYNISWTDLGAPGPISLYPCAAEGNDPPTPSDGNPGGLLCAIFVPGDHVTAPVYVYTSDDSWMSWYDPTTWPGWTPGQIIQQLIDEADARGAISIYDSSTFTAPNDSDSLAWRPIMTDVDRPDIPTFSVEVGSTILTALGQLHDSGYIIVDDAAAIAAYGTRVEDVYSSDAPSEQEAELQGINELLRRAQGSYPALVAAVEPTSTADCPYEAFEVGDYVTVPGGSVVRVLSINCTQDQEGWATWTLELNERLDVPERRTNKLLQQLGGRNQVIRGRVV
jgi:hypothetical protein